jgi:hypothetical protein
MSACPVDHDLSALPVVMTPGSADSRAEDSRDHDLSALPVVMTPGSADKLAAAPEFGEFLGARVKLHLGPEQSGSDTMPVVQANAGPVFRGLVTCVRR